MDCSNYSGVLVLSCCDLEPSFIVKLILEKESLPICPKLVDGVEAYPWHITTKYYETDVLLYTLSEKKLLPESLAKGVQAVIVVFDSLKDNGLEIVQSWQPFVQGYEADISILLCNRCTESPSSGVSKLAAQEWCVQRGYELVELDPELDEEWESEQDFIETTGIKRVVQALQAHIWPDLTLKERKEPTSMSALLHGGADSVQQDMSQLRLDQLPPDLALTNIEDRLDELLSCGSESDFTQLFGELQTMKQRVSALPSDQRKACAEQVVMAFWSAIGGDSDEITEPPPGS